MLLLSIDTAPWATRQTFSRFSCSVVLLLPRGSFADRGSTGVAFLFSPGVETLSRGDGNVDRGEGATFNSMILLQPIAKSLVNQPLHTLILIFFKPFLLFFELLLFFVILQVFF